MSGDTDKLAQIERHIASPLIGWTELENRDVLALVEIAKTARELSDDNTSLGGKFAILRAALSALDGDT